MGWYPIPVGGFDFYAYPIQLELPNESIVVDEFIYYRPDHFAFRDRGHIISRPRFHHQTRTIKMMDDPNA